jgi:hypothetical protein
VLLAIAVDGAPVGYALADIPRADLANPGGFLLALPDGLDPARSHSVGIRRATDGAELYATLAIIPPTPGIAERLGLLDADTPTARARHAAFLIDQIARLRGRFSPPRQHAVEHAPQQPRSNFGH